MFYRTIFPLLVAISVVCAGTLSAQSKPIPLAGEWRFAMDRADAGITEKWFVRALPEKIRLPGVLQAQGYGDEISTYTPWVLSLYDKNWFLRADYTNYTRPGAVKVPFLCQPPRHYLGAAWYQRDIEIPTDWTGRRVVLFLERPHWESRVWLDDRLVGTNNSLCAPHEFELGVNLSPGKHMLTVRVDNRLLLPYRPDAHSVSDSLAQSWNGIVGAMELRSTPPVWIEDVRIFPDVSRTSALVKVLIGNATGLSVSNWVSLNFIPRMAAGGGLPQFLKVVSTSQWTSVEAELRSGYPIAGWDEFNPQLFELTVTKQSPDALDEASREIKRVRFGFREFRAVMNQFTINGRPAYLRGTHHGGDFPLTGYPPTDTEYWRKLFRTCKEWGLNHMRFHSFCPPEAAFTAADETGFYLQIEPGMWNTFDPGSPMEQMLYDETERILKAYGNHPSFVLFSPSNEPKGKWRDVLPKWAEHFRASDSRRLYTSGTGFTDPDAPGPLDKVDYTATQRFGQQRVRRESAWFGDDYSQALEGVNVPVVTHELGQWCAYPDFSVIKKFTGYMRPGNYEIFRDSAEVNGLFGRAGSPLPAETGKMDDGAQGTARPANKDFAWASGRFQLACYKEEIEANLRTPGLAGFQLLDLHDYVGQCTALVGLLDPFWESKGYATPEGFRKFCSITVPLARLKQRVLTTLDKFEVPVEVAHFGAEPLTNATTSWEIRDARGKTVTGGGFAPATIPIGKNFALGKITVDLSKLLSPGEFKLVVLVGDDVRSLKYPESAGSVLKKKLEPPHVGSYKVYENDWNFWVYPASAEAGPTNDVLVTSSWADATAKLAAGGKVLFLPRAADLDWTCPLLDNVPVFWNRLMNPQWSRMLGLWCDAQHPALAEFPTDAHCDWQWTQIVRGVRAVNLAKLPRGLRPIVSAIDDWNRNWKLGVLFEAKVGNGKLLVSAVDVERNQNPVARQLRRSLLNYMAGEKFQPQTEISQEQFNGLHFDSLVMRKLGATAQADGEDAGAAIDGDPNTSWLLGTARRGRNAPPPPSRPHTLTIAFTNTVAVDGLILLNRQNDRDHIGDVRNFKVAMSKDGTNWTDMVEGELASTWSPQEVRFGKTITARQIRFTSLTGFGNDTASALAELAVIYTGQKPADADQPGIEYKRIRATTPDIDESGAPAVPRTNTPTQP